MTDSADALDKLGLTEKRALLQRLLVERAVPVAYPLTALQQSLFFFEQITSATTVHVNRAVLRVRGAFDATILDRAVGTVIRRQAALRTSFATENGVPVQIVHATAPSPVSFADLSAMPAERLKKECDEIAARTYGQPFELTRPPLLRIAVARTAANEHRLFLGVHQLVCDGWSWTVLLREIVAAYGDLAAGQAVSLPPLATDITQVLARRRARETSDVVAADLGYWETRLADAPPSTEWPIDRGRPTVRSYEGAVVRHLLSAETTAGMLAAARAHGATPFMFALAAFEALLYRHTAQTDLVIGTPIAGRDDPDSTSLIGCLIDTLALRTKVDGARPFTAVLSDVRDAVLGALAHQAAPFPAVLERIGTPRDRSRTPLFQILFNYMRFPIPTMQLSNAIVETEALFEGDLKFDLTLYLSEQDGSLLIDALYAKDLFHESSARAMLADYASLLDAVTRQSDIALDDIPLSRPPFRTCESPLPAPADFVAVPAGAIETTIAARFQRVVERHGDLAAVAAPSGRWTYRELAARVAAVANAVHAIGQDSPFVGLLCDNDASMIAGMFGILHAGRGYVPLDTLAPLARLEYILGDAEATCVVADRANRDLAARLVGEDRVIAIDGCRPAPLPRMVDVSPEKPAYLLYTSGSTGNPKGVMQSERNVLYFNREYTNNLRLSPSDRLSLVSSYCFDAAVMDIFGALLSGATLVIADIRRDGIDALARRIRDESVSILHATPTVFRRIAAPNADADDFRSVRAVVLGGEEALGADFDRFRRCFPRGSWLVNGLGPSESTVALQAFFAATDTVDHHSLPIGLPVAGTAVLLVDSNGRPDPLRGELVIRSKHVALGYWKQAEVTSRAFGTDGETSERWFRSGDLVRRLADGRLAFLGRKDTQVKIRGYRIEAGEVETRLARHPSIARAAVVAVGSADSERRLVAFVEGASAESIDPRQLLRWLRTELPDYMIPSDIEVVDALPQTASGKIDRRTLTDRAFSVRSPRVDRAVVPPSSQTERSLAHLWSEVLNAPEIGRDDDFFALGGHSLAATQVVSRVRTQWGVDLPLRALFDAPTIAEFAAAIEASTSFGGADVEREEMEL